MGRHRLGVVDDYVEPAESLKRGGDRVLRVAALTHVAGDGDDIGALLAQDIGLAVELVLDPARQHELRPFVRQCMRNAEAHALPAPSHDRDHSVQPAHIQSSPRWFGVNFIACPQAAQSLFNGILKR